jgi:tripartite motif-containing protein 71
MRNLLAWKINHHIIPLFVFVLLATFPQTLFAFDEQVEFLQELKTYLADPVDVATDDRGEIYILDKKSAEVITFDSLGKFKSLCGSKGSKPGQLKNPRALAITPSREIVVADSGNNRIQVFSPKGDFLFEFGNTGSGRGEFLNPTGVAVDSSGYLYVADYGNKRLQSFSPKGVHVGTLPLSYPPLDIAVDRQSNIYLLSPEQGKIFTYSSAGVFVKELTGVFQRKNYLRAATAIVVDQQGHIYFSETAEHSIKKIDQGQKLLLSFGSEGTQPGQFNQPMGLSTKEARLLVADSQNRRIQVFQIKGASGPSLSEKEAQIPIVEFDSYLPASPSLIDLTYSPQHGLYALSDQEKMVYFYGPDLQRFGDAAVQDRKFKNPSALAIDADGQMLIADTGHNQIQILTSEGARVLQFGKPGDKTGQFNQPQGVAINSRGNIFIADTQNDRIQIFNKWGIFLQSFGTTSKMNQQKIPEPGNFRQPKALAIDSQDQVYVADYANNRVQIFNENGVFLKDLGTPGKGPGQLDKIVDLAIDERDFLYLADQGNNRIQIFDPQGQFVVAFGSIGQGPSCFPKLSGVAAASGKIYVANYNYDQIKVFTFSSPKLADIQKQEKAIVSVPKIETQPESPVLQPVTNDNPKGPEIPNPNVEEKVESIASTSESPQEERISVTKNFYLPPNFDKNNVEQMRQVRLLTHYEAVKDLANMLGASESEIVPVIRVEKEEYIDKDRFQMILSAPKHLPQKKAGKKSN